MSLLVKSMLFTAISTPSSIMGAYLRAIIALDLAYDYIFNRFEALS